ncbi:MAG TPA: hypothetical protein VNW54_07745 [Granulicella sp.]|jgi:hypothetical protein|nr:hypothetical protein [Granulicella sp.]
MATEAPEKLLLSDTLRQATEALALLDTAALEPLIARLAAVRRACSSWSGSRLR